MDTDDITPARVIREGFRWTPAVLIIGGLLIVVFTVLSLFVWHIGGVFQKNTIQRNYTNTVQSQQYQAALLAQMQQHLESITGPGGLAAARAGLPSDSGEQQVLRAQELNELSQLCSESAGFAPQAVPGGRQMQDVINANCSAGTVIADPALAPAPGSGA